MTGAQDEFMVRSAWPSGDITEAFYSSQRAAELEAYLRRRYSQCQVEVFCRQVLITDWKRLDAALIGPAS
jgi:hypothetical protein